MTIVRRLNPNSPGHGFWPVSGRERVGNEATVSTWFVAGLQNVGFNSLEARDGWLADESLITVTDSSLPDRFGGVMMKFDRSHWIARRLSPRSNGRALEEAKKPNKPCHATRNRFAIAHQTLSFARVRA